MIEIEKLRMHLPTGFEHRAMVISRLVGQALANKHISTEKALDELSLPAVKIRLHSSDSEIADLIVKEIATAVEGWDRES